MWRRWRKRGSKDVEEEEIRGWRRKNRGNKKERRTKEDLRRP